MKKSIIAMLLCLIAHIALGQQYRTLADALSVSSSYGMKLVDGRSVPSIHGRVLLNTGVLNESGDIDISMEPGCGIEWLTQKTELGRGFGNLAFYFEVTAKFQFNQSHAIAGGFRSNFQLIDLGKSGYPFVRWEFGRRFRFCGEVPINFFTQETGRFGLGFKYYLGKNY